MVYLKYLSIYLKFSASELCVRIIKLQILNTIMDKHIFSEGSLTSIPAESLDTIETIAHAFYTRSGGISTGSFTSLNVSYAQDERQIVDENRKRVADHISTLCPVSELELTRLFAPRLCHSSEVYVLQGGESASEVAAQKADAIVTKSTLHPLCVYSADCAPVLLADGKAGVIGAVHAGWRGALSGVLDNTIEAMVRLGATASDIASAIGPCIHQQNYEVGPDLVEKFTQVHGSMAKTFFDTPPGNDRPNFDLPQYVAFRLRNVGVTQCEVIPVCTFENERLFSYRRNCKTGVVGFGCQPSVIMLKTSTCALHGTGSIQTYPVSP